MAEDTVEYHPLSVVNHLTIHRYCNAVAKILSIVIACVKILSIFWQLFTNSASRDKNRVSAPEVLRAAHIS